MRVCVYVTHTRAHAHAHTMCVYIYIYLCVCVRACVNLFIHQYLSICLYIYIYIYLVFVLLLLLLLLVVFITTSMTYRHTVYTYHRSESVYQPMDMYCGKCISCVNCILKLLTYFCIIIYHHMCVWMKKKWLKPSETIWNHFSHSHWDGEHPFSPCSPRSTA